MAWTLLSANSPTMQYITFYRGKNSAVSDGAKQYFIVSEILPLTIE